MPSSMLDAFNMINGSQTFESVNESYHQPQVVDYDVTAQNAQVCLDRYAQFVSRPLYNPNIDALGGLSAHSPHWGSYAEFMQSLSASGIEMGPLQEKLDANRIFTADVAAYKTLASDQSKRIKAFERKFMEKITAKGQYGLDESDIEAFQALTAACNTLSQIQDKQVTVKKHIADIKLKQQQIQSGGSGNGNSQNGAPGRPTSAYDIGRSMLDQIFDVPGVGNPQQNVVNVEYPAADLNQASDILDNIVGSDIVPVSTAYETAEPTTYVVVGDSDSDTEFVTISSSGEILKNYPNPETNITSIDRESGTAIDDLLVSYPIKRRDEL